MSTNTISPYMNQKQAADYIGINVKTFRKHVQKKLKFKEIGNQIIFTKTDIDDFMTLDSYSTCSR